MAKLNFFKFKRHLTRTFFPLDHRDGVFMTISAVAVYVLASFHSSPAGQYQVCGGSHLLKAPPCVCTQNTLCSGLLIAQTQNTDANTNTKRKPGLIILKAPQCVNTKHVVLRNSHIWKRNFAIIYNRYIRLSCIYIIGKGSIPKNGHF